MLARGTTPGTPARPPRRAWLRLVGLLRSAASGRVGLLRSVGPSSSLACVRWPAEGQLRLYQRRRFSAACAENRRRYETRLPDRAVFLGTLVMPVTPSGRVPARPARGAEGASSPQPLRRQDRTGQASLKLTPVSLNDRGGAEAADPARWLRHLREGPQCWSGGRPRTPRCGFAAEITPGARRLTDPSAQEAPGWSN